MATTRSTCPNKKHFFTILTKFTAFVFIKKQYE